MRLSLKARLVAGMSFVALVLVASALAITAFTRNHLTNQVDARLETVASQIGGPGPRPGGSPPPPTDLSDLTDVAPPNDSFDPPGDPSARPVDVYRGFVAPDGTVTVAFAPNIGDGAGRAPRIRERDLPESGRHYYTVTSERGDVSFRVLAATNPSGTQVTAIPIDDVEDTLATLVRVELVAGTAMLAVLALVTWWVIRLGIRPINDMAHTAQEIADGDLTVRVPEAAPGTESGELAVALNRMLERIEDALARRERAEQRLLTFVSDASHELRTPITTIRGYAELYRAGGMASKAALDDAMRRTELEAARMGRLVEDMLTLAKLDQKRPLEIETIDIRELARDAARDAAVVAPDRPITLDEPDEPLVVEIDEDRVRQVLANVMSNALVHTAPEVPVHVTTQLVDDAAVIEVADEGQGIPQDMVDQVTDRFFRVDPSRSRHSGGSGLGLAIAADTIAAHGGTISVASELDRGTTVRITLPVRAPALSAS